MKTVVAIVSILLSLLFLGSIYYTASFSSVRPPIKEYKFNGTEDILIKNLETINFLDSYNLKWKDTTGKHPEFYDIYFDIIDLDSCSYHLKYSVEKDQEIKVSLIRVFDLKHKKGGYSNSKDPIIETFQIKFEKELKNKIIKI